ISKFTELPPTGQLPFGSAAQACFIRCALQLYRNQPRQSFQGRDFSASLRLRSFPQRDPTRIFRYISINTFPLDAVHQAFYSLPIVDTRLAPLAIPVAVTKRSPNMAASFRSSLPANNC